MKRIYNAIALTDFLNRVLPKYVDTGLAKDLRRLDPDATNDKNVIAWVGSRRMADVWKFRITVNLAVYPVGMWPSDEQVAYGKELAKALKLKLNPPRNRSVKKVVVQTNSNRIRIVSQEVAQVVQEVAQVVQVAQVAQVATPVEAIDVPELDTMDADAGPR